MSIFRPPTDRFHSLSNFDIDIPWSAEKRLAYNFLRHYRALPQGRNVYKLTDGTYVENQPADMSTVSVVYHGGHDHVVTDQEVSDLTAAGYGSYISDS